MKKISIFGFAITVVVFVATIIFVFYLQATGQVKFMPDRFTEEFWKFLANLVSIAFGFVLINVFWSRKEQRDKISQGKGILLNYLLRINRLCLRINELLSINYSETEFEKSQARDNDVVALSYKIQKLAGSLENMTFDPLILSDLNIREVFVELLWEELLPSIDSLLNQDNFRKDFVLFMKTVSEITACSRKGVEKLIPKHQEE
ncbi:MAG: hypothetical protein IH588_16250 [Anaerolineales bacterium]|nr:hypothetical protein [Anaerolineales bacterium]